MGQFILENTEIGYDDIILINESINEELGISKDVTNTCYEILDKIETTIDTYNDYQSFTNGMYYGNTILDLEIFGTPIKLYLYIFKANNMSDIKRLRSFVGNKINGVSNFDNRTIKLTVNVINGRFDENGLITTLQHELHHFYEDTKRGYHKGFDNLYVIATKVIANQSLNIKIDVDLAKIIYLLHPKEVRAYENSAYIYCVNNAEYVVYDSLKKTELFNIIKTVDKLYDNIVNEPGFEKSLHRFGLTRNKFEKLFSSGRNLVINSIGRVIVKVQQELSNNFDGDL